MKHCKVVTFSNRPNAQKMCDFWNINNPAPFKCVLRFKRSNKIRPFKVFCYEI